MSGETMTTITASTADADPKKTFTEQTLIWKRESVTIDNNNADADISFPVADDAFVENDEEPTSTKNHSISEDEIQKNLGLRRQASFLRKASIMDSLEKYYEPEPMKKTTTKAVASKEFEMRQTRISEELNTMIEKMIQSRDFEDDDETDMEPQAHLALVKAAEDLCYTRKYYDSSSDEIIYFPSPVKTILNNSLFEKADEYYAAENEDEEFPEEYAIGLRKVAFEQKEDEDDGLHRDDSDGEEEDMEYAMMLQLSQPVELTAPKDSPNKRKSKPTNQSVALLKDKRMDASEETIVWTRTSRSLDPDTSVEVAIEAEENMVAALAAAAAVQTPSKNKPKEDGVVTEDDVQEKLGMRRQESFLRKAAVLDSIGKHEGEDNVLPDIGESSAGKKKAASGRPSTLVDTRMDTSEEVLVWTRNSQIGAAAAAASIPSEVPAPAVSEQVPASDKKPAGTKEEEEEEVHDESESPDKKKKSNPQPSILVDNRMDTPEGAFVWTRTSQAGAATSIPFEPVPVAEQPVAVTKEEEEPPEKPSVTEEEVRQKLEMRRQASFLRKAAVLDSIVKYEGEENLPAIGESSTKKKKSKGRPSTLVDHRMDEAEETFVWTRSNRNLGADAHIEFGSFGPGDKPVFTEEKKIAPVKKPATVVTQEEVKERLGLRREASTLRKTAIMDSLGKWETEEDPLPENQNNDEGTTETAASDDTNASTDEKKTAAENAKKPLSEAAKRQEMIDTEMNGMLDEMMKSEDFEEEDEMEKESRDAIMKAAKEICYLRKYYDISSDKVIYFPSITKTIVQYDLFEKATEYYYDEDDEFPTEYTMGLRQVAFDRIEAEGGDDDNEELDDDMMERLSMPVQLTEDEPDALQEAAAAEEEEAGDEEKENQALDSNTDQVEEPKEETPKKPLSEAARRQEMIDTEMNGMLDEMMKSEDFEEEDEMEKESRDAIMKAAKEICYLRKYYDISSDKVIYFPSVTKTIVQYDLFEKATEYYYDEDDEFPTEYTMGLRQVAFDRIEAEGGDDDNEEMDDDMMERLSMPVQLTEDEPDVLQEAAAAEEEEEEETGDEEKENRALDSTEDQAEEREEKDTPKKPLSEAAKRQEMIETELNGMIDEMMKSEDFEEEDEMEKESRDAIMKAAKEICYTKKYYNISADKVVYFPSITKTIVQYDLFEKATEYYYDEDDEFPTEYTMGLRQVAFDRIEAEGGEDDDDEMDDDMMERLSMPVQLTEDEPDVLQEAAAAEEEEEEETGDEEKENQAPESNEDQAEEPKEETTKKPLSEAARRQEMIDTELNGMLDEMMKSEDFEEEDEMEKESREAIMKAAKEICYTKKYYNISADKVVYFPSLTKTIVQYDLFEKATEYYYDEDDEFPTEYTMGLRQVAFDRIEAEGGEDDDDEMDDDMMERLSMPVQLTEDEPDILQEAAAAEEKENQAPESNSEDQAEEPTEETPKKPLSEAAKRQEMIDTELNGMIDEMMKSEDFEEEDEMEKESREAIMKAAKEICYTRKYYNISSDKVVYFPSITKTIVQYDLFEKATEYYYDEDDEFPTEYTMGLRQVAFDRIEAEGDDEEDDEMDDDMMERLSMPVQLTEDEPDPLQEAAAAEEEQEQEEEAVSESSGAEDAHVGKAVLPAAVDDDQEAEKENESRAVKNKDNTTTPRQQQQKPQTALGAGKEIATAAVKVVGLVAVDAVGLFFKTVIFPTGMF